MFWTAIKVLAPVVFILPFLAYRFPNLYSWRSLLIMSLGVALFILALVALRRLLCKMKVVVCEENTLKSDVQ